ncbi:hypothetical protein F0562_023537 [Nyssa sinensis]|uniref:Acetyl-coenzyme A synthetase N-terminal domain-containing protein n=1 Tax=Nyssa sinensis TaxID=561372 RepID=A0A5J5BKH9_9ASTE|nr:hypothetical protein F0562_023537 [Nyssa sinensis]
MAYKALDCITSSDIAALGVPSDVADRLYDNLTQIIRTYGPATPQTWQHISKHLLNPDLPFSLHQMMYYGCYRDFGPDPPAWLPDADSAKLTNVGQLLERRGKEFLGSKYKDPISSFSDFQEFSVSNPEDFWKTVLDELSVSFSVPPQCILRDNPSAESHLSHPGGQWLPGAYVNPAKNCLRLNGKRTLDDIMVIWRDEGDDEMPVNKMTLKELWTEVWLVAHALGTLGFEKGSCDCNRYANGCQFCAKAIFTQDLIVRGDKRLPLYSRVVDAQSPMAIVIPTRGSFSMKLRDGDISWHDFLEKVKNLKEVEFVAVERPVRSIHKYPFLFWNHRGTKGNSMDPCNTF